MKESFHLNGKKTALVMPLYKKGDEHCSGNYRPVSRLSCIGKLAEGCVYKHIYNCLIANNLIYLKGY